MIIGISGKKQSGKDTTGKIINILANSPHLNNEGVLNFLRKDVISDSNWKIKKFADKLKDVVCLLIECTREQLEDEDFKNTPLGNSWTKYKVVQTETDDHNYSYSTVHYFETLDDADIFILDFPGYDYGKVEEIIMTPRLMLQLIGTEWGREIIHPNIWVNSLMSEYVPTLRRFNAIKRIDKYFVPEGHGEYSGKQLECSEFEYDTYPNWIITDMRFPNELEAVEDKEGITIRVERDIDRPEDEHISETALDDAIFNYKIHNQGTLDELINRVREILIKEEII